MKLNVMGGAALGVVLVAALTGCRADAGTSSGGAGAPVEARESPGSTQQRAAGAERCTADVLRARLGGLDQAAGAASSAVVVVNVGAASCYVRGYPGVAFADADGGLMLGSSERVGGPATRVTLRPGASAWAGIDWTAPRTPAEAAYVHAPRLLTVIPPDDTVKLKVPWTFGTPGDRGHIRIQPFRAGTGPS
ncbi:DUF4232 domain-containing protein [Actinomadura parmotrematis]|uniref:DUF4232 domain-containing protein n=1 Tax=Actinomadura parmotrematis TaxID=2864039 RepID=A0ABS7FVV6_9ACTN|nr:DUF4232 domain-containing protein [Actinomadura parmotrematis]MBW8484110.1 DUF4232 domain-containing protein [Actinomadura parmotrematis]